jgi:hypothetical protein
MRGDEIRAGVTRGYRTDSISIIHGDAFQANARITTDNHVRVRLRLLWLSWRALDSHALLPPVITKTTTQVSGMPSRAIGRGGRSARMIGGDTILSRSRYVEYDINLARGLTRFRVAWRSVFR